MVLKTATTWTVNLAGNVELGFGNKSLSSMPGEERIEAVSLLSKNLDLSRCPHCSVANPNLERIHDFETRDHEGQNRRHWRLYVCSRCGNAVIAYSTRGFNEWVDEYFPKAREVDATLPQKVQSYLQQATESLHAPAGAVMLAASAVDSMLKEKSYTEGSLYTRIDEAVEDGLITKEMAKWAHDVRLDANDQRHADEDAALPTTEDAKRVVDFAVALGDFLFVIPSRVKRGIVEASEGHAG